MNANELAQRTLARLMPEQAEKLIIDNLLKFDRGEIAEFDSRIMEWAIAAKWVTVNRRALLVDVTRRTKELLNERGIYCA
jgi:hypothetical protein